MGVFSQIGRALRLKASRTVALESLFPGLANFPDQTFQSHFCNGYAMNDVVFACVNKRSQSFAQAPIQVVDKKGNEHPQDATRQLLNRPNPFMSEVDLWMGTMDHYQLAGNAFWLKVRSGSGRVVEVWLIRPDRVRIYADRTRFVSHYTVEVDGKEVPVAVADMLHFRTPNPWDAHWGFPWVQAALRQYATDNEATSFTKLLLQNRAMPGVVVTTEREDMDEDTADRLRAKWWQRFGGRGRGGVVFLQRGMDVKALGLNMRDLRFPDLTAVSETRICAVLDTPPIIINLKSGIDRGTFTNYGQARQHYWEESICPLHEIFAARLNMDPDLGRDRDGVVRFDARRITALLGVRERQQTLGTQGWLSGMMQLNEARAIAGLQPVPDGDRFIERTQGDIPDGDVTPRGLQAAESILTRRWNGHAQPALYS